MQDKDFDNHIRKVLDDYSEEIDYNPADWDSLEDRLQNLGGSSSGGTAPAGGSKIIGWGAGKIASAAAVVLIGAANMVLFFRSPEVAEKAEQVTVQTTETRVHAEEQAPALREETLATATGSATGISQAEFQPEHKLQPNVTALKTEAQEQIGAPAIKAETAPARANTAQKANRKAGNTPAKVAGVPSQRAALASMSSGTYAGSEQRHSNAGYNGRESGSSACASNTRPQIPFIIVGKDTLTSFKLMVQACDVLNFRIVSQDPDETDKLSISSDLATALPGAVLQVNHTNRPTGMFSWAPTAADVKPEPYYFNVTVADGKCETSARSYRFEITVVSPIMVKLNGNTRIDKGDFTQLQVEGAEQGSTFRWSPDNGTLSQLHAAQTVVNPTVSTTYYVQITNAAGCTFTDSIHVEVRDNVYATDSEVVIPNILTPNNDGKNDVFEVRALAAGTYSLNVFDGMGRKVYGSDRYKNNWRAEGLPGGVYYYVITIPETGKTYKGWIEVLY